MVIFTVSRVSGFPIGFHEKVQNLLKSPKITKITKIPQNVTDRSDTLKSDILDTVLVKFCTFLHFPRGLDKGFGHFCQCVHAWCRNVAQWCQNWQN